jgi:hypothetical protein
MGKGVGSIGVKRVMMSVITVRIRRRDGVWTLKGLADGGV